MSGVVVDLVAAQSPSYRGRGIARHGMAFARALVARHPHLVEAVIGHPELPPVDGLDELGASGKLRTTLPPGDGGVYHLPSALEPEVPARVLWPREATAQRRRLVVTLHDLIPARFPEQYLRDHGLRRRWRSCLELARVADHVFAVSASTGADAVELLGISADRVSVIGSGVEPHFHPGGDRSLSLRRAATAVEGLGRRFVVYNGALDPRKNVPRLIEAFARLPPHLADLQLVLVAAAEPLERNHHLVGAARMGLDGRVLWPAAVSDEALVALYRSCVGSVFPSLYEGYGLPVIEARACGAPVVVGDNSSLREIAPPMARFDATDVDAIVAAITRLVDDEGYRAELLRQTSGAVPTWGDVADVAAAGYEALLERDRRRLVVPGWRKDPVVAVVVDHDGPGGRDERLARAIEAGAEVVRFADPAPAPGATGALPLSTLERVGRWKGGWDAIVDRPWGDQSPPAGAQPDDAAVQAMADAALSAARSALAAGHSALLGPGPVTA